jgi:hypothetical protein
VSLWFSKGSSQIGKRIPKVEFLLPSFFVIWERLQHAILGIWKMKAQTQLLTDCHGSTWILHGSTYPSNG